MITGAELATRGERRKGTASEQQKETKMTTTKCIRARRVLFKKETRTLVRKNIDSSSVMPRLNHRVVVCSVWDGKRKEGEGIMVECIVVTCSHRFLALVTAKKKYVSKPRKVNIGRSSQNGA